MPFVHITLLEGRTPDEKSTMLKSVHQALVDTGMPETAIRIWLTEVKPTEFMIAGTPASERR